MLFEISGNKELVFRTLSLILNPFRVLAGGQGLGRPSILRRPPEADPVIPDVCATAELQTLLQAAAAKASGGGQRLVPRLHDTLSEAALFATVQRGPSGLQSCFPAIGLISEWGPCCP